MDNYQQAFEWFLQTLEGFVEDATEIHEGWLHFVAHPDETELPQDGVRRVTRYHQGRLIAYRCALQTGKSLLEMAHDIEMADAADFKSSIG